MNILLTGASGLIGSHIKENLEQHNFAKILAPTSQDFNVTSPESVNSYFNNHLPKIVIHSAAFTDVTGGELQRNDKNGTAWKINVEGTQNIVDVCKKNDVKLIHISTDVIFSGREDDKGPYTESHQPETNPDMISWYGWTKSVAERAVIQELASSAIVRISNPTRAAYDRKLDYVRKIVAAYDLKKPVRLFDDQHLTLTYVNDVSEAVFQIIQKDLQGIFHVSSANLFTPYELAEYTLDKARNVNGIVQRSSIEEFLKQPGNASRYPQYGGLKVQESQTKLGMQFKTWQEIINSLIKEGL